MAVRTRTGFRDTRSGRAGPRHVVTDLDAGYGGSLADLATKYGWFDQAHFTREFTDLVGVPPGTYQRQ